MWFGFILIDPLMRTFFRYVFYYNDFKLRDPQYEIKKKHF